MPSKKDPKGAEKKPSARPPKKWWDEKIKEVETQTPPPSDPAKIVGAMWAGLSDAKKSEIREREGKVYKPADKPPETPEKPSKPETPPEGKPPAKPAKPQEKPVEPPKPDPKAGQGHPDKCDCPLCVLFGWD